MIKPDEEILRALASLGSTPRDEIILKWFRASHDAVMKSIGDNTVFNAGRAAELYDILKHIQTARANLDQLIKK